MSLYFKKIGIDLKSWDRETFSCVVHTNILKMTILPRVLFFLQMVPVPLPSRFFKELHSLFIRFVWRGKRPRLAVAMLHRTKQNGGLGLPNISQYYQAIALQRIVNWKFHTSSKLWVQMEKVIAGRNLAYTSWVPSDARGLSEWVCLLTVHTLKAWDRLNRVFALAPPTSQLAPVGRFPWFPPDDQLASLETWVSDGICSLTRFAQGHTMVPLSTLREHYGSFPFDFWRHCQLANFITLQHHGSQIRTTLMDFSALYKLLEVAKPNPKPIYNREWERDIKRKFTNDQLNHLYYITHSGSGESKTQENNCKILSRWYQALVILARIYPSTSDLS